MSGSGVLVSPGEVGIWHAQLDTGASAEDWTILDASERAAADRFALKHLRSRYIVAHSTLRRRLAAQLGMEPAAVTIARRPCVRCGDPHGKPYLVDAQGLDFNLAHSGGLASIALGVEIEVGIDIEMLGQATRVQGVAERFLAPSEQAALARLPEAVRDITCLAQWTRKEAWCKGTGAGLAPDLRELVIDPVPPRDGTRLSVPDAGGSWTLVDVILQGAVGTLAARPEPSRVWAFGSMPDGGSPEGATKR